MTRCVKSRNRGVRALSLATGLAIGLAASASWGHKFPPVRTVVVQVESCELAVLVGYRAASGEATDKLVARGASLPKSQAADGMRDLLAAQAMAPLAFSVDGRTLVPTSVRAKLSLEGDGSRAMVVVLTTYKLPPGKELAVASKDTRTTRISWTDRESHRVTISEAPAQGRWFAGVASFVLPLVSPSGGQPCVTPRPSSSPAPSSPR
jgi:hypothetical protein